MSLVRRSIAIALADTYAVMAIQFAASVVIARLLTPDEIGVFSVAVLAVSIAQTFREFGIVSYLIKEEALTDDKIRAASALSFLVSWLLGGVVFASSFWVAAFYRDPRLLHLLWVLAANFVLVPFGSIVHALLRREMRMGSLLVVRVAATAVSALVAVGLAWWGMGAMSLALSLTANLVVSIIGVQFFRPAGMPRRPAFRGVRSILGFSRQTLTSNLAVEVARAAPDIVLGRVQNMTAVGLFGRAMGLVDLFGQVIANSLWSVSLPYFSRIKREGGSIGAALARTQAYITGVAWPFYAVLGICAQPVILTVYGAQWKESVGVAQLLCVFGAVTVTTAFASTAMVAADRVGAATGMMVKACAVRIAVVLAFAPFGIMALGGAMIGAAILEFALGVATTRRALGVNWSSMAPGYARSGIVAVLCALLPSALLAAGAMDTLSLGPLLAVAAASVATWLAGLFAARHPLRDEVRTAWHDFATRRARR